MDRLNELYGSIYNPKTKIYFEEVLKSYRNENYRSAIVMMYTVVICDLVFKLTDLKDIHNDLKAEKILTDLNADRQLNPVSSQWENDLIEKAFTEANLLETDVYAHIQNLKKYRNLCAHPALNSLEILYNPNPELVYASMINILEGLLTKHPMFTKNVFVPFLIEVERVKGDFLTNDRLEQYLNSKFFVHFNFELIKYIFKNLWKFVFNKDGSKETVNREVNYKVLVIIYKKYEPDLLTFIQENKEHFSEFKDDHKVITEMFFEFLSTYPEIYQHLSDHSKEILENRAKSSKSLYIKSYFAADSLNEHLVKIAKNIHTDGVYHNQPYRHTYRLTPSEVLFLEKICTAQGCLSEFYDLMISHYYHSGSFDVAEVVFSICIEGYYENFTKEQFETLFREAKYNPQCSGRRFSANDHKRLIKRAEDVGVIEVKKNYEILFE